MWLSRVSLEINPVSHWLHLNFLKCFAWGFTSCGSACFSSAFFARNSFFLRMFLFTVLGLSFFLSWILAGIFFSWLKSIEKLKPVGRERENLKSIPLLAMCLVKSMPWGSYITGIWTFSVFNGSKKSHSDHLVVPFPVKNTCPRFIIRKTLKKIIIWHDRIFN